MANKGTILELYLARLNQLARLKDLAPPEQGWLRLVRQVLGMSSPQLAKRLKVSKSQASQLERMEAQGRITLKTLRQAADKLECDLVYALVPRGSIEEILQQRVRQKAARIVYRANVALGADKPVFTPEEIAGQIDREADILMRTLPRDLWQD